MNGKLYPMAKVQLGKMGALHPANRLAAYLTGRVGCSRKWSSSSSTVVSKPAQVQGSAPAPRPVAQACVGGTPPPGPEPPAKAAGRCGASWALVKGSASCVRNGSSLPASGVVTALAPPPVLPSKGSKLYMVPVLSSSGKVPPLQGPLPASTSQKMVLYPVKSTLGVQYYRRTDGQLYRLLPLSQLKPFRQNQPGQKGESGSRHRQPEQRSGGQPVSVPASGLLPPVLPVVVRQTVSRPPPVTSVLSSVLAAVTNGSSSSSTFTSSTSSTSTSPASSLLGGGALSLPSPLLPPAGLLSQKDQRPSKTVPTSSCSSLPGSTSVTCALPADPSRLSVPQEVTAPAGQGSEDESLQQIGSELELACNASDQDESSSSDESLDFEDGDVDGGEEKDQLRKNVSFNALLFSSPCWKEDRMVMCGV